MRTVLAAIDNSAAARPVLSVALEVGRTLGAETVAVHVSEHTGLTAEQAAGAAGVRFRTIPGPIGPALVRAAEQGEVQAIVLGARGLPGGPLPAGHVALEVAAHVRIPAVIVPPEIEPTYRLRRALVPMPGDPVSSPSLERTIELAEGAQIDVVILHVYDIRSVPSFQDQPHHDVEAWAREFVARWVPVLGPGRVRMEQRVGVPAQEIVDVAREVEADLVVLGWSQDLSAGRAAVVRAVLAAAPVPLALVPVVSVLDLALLEQDEAIRRPR